MTRIGYLSDMVATGQYHRYQGRPRLSQYRHDEILTGVRMATICRLYHSYIYIYIYVCIYILSTAQYSETLETRTTTRYYIDYIRKWAALLQNGAALPLHRDKWSGAPAP